MQDECYNIIFRKKIYTSLAELQLDVDIGCILTIDLDRIQVNIAMVRHLCKPFFDSMHIAYQKNIDSIKQDADFGFDFVNSSVS
ncbi:ISSod13 transposase [Trichonephila clavata]|uniref:ISSod13 transposase n=1 Tax=Trichonephila clavata TaxID=2740835 RepID=A0A8X6H7W2_TRICU|nr:ISSod13 transposase [Trichonephila clavata]